MADAYLGEIRIFAGNYAPKDWAFCNGQLMSIAQNSALYSLIGVTYGGDGKSIFALPNLQGRAPMHAGNGAGLTPRNIGEGAGSTSVTLTEPEIPLHTHVVNATKSFGTSDKPSAEAIWSSTPGLSGPKSYTDGDANVSMNMLSASSTGGTQPHNNRQPYNGLNFIICLKGEFPQRP